MWRKNFESSFETFEKSRNNQTTLNLLQEC